MSAEVTLQIEGQPPQTFPVGTLFSIGRGPGNHVVINDARASRNHAVIRLQADRVYCIQDLGSSNGTMLNGRRIITPAVLRSGDEVKVANGRLLFTQKTVPEQPLDETAIDEMRTQVEFTSETVSILVVDIRNYTGLSEGIPTEDLSKTIGKWFQEVGVAIEHNGGEIDKFIGDAVMAYWLKTSADGDRKYVLGPIKAAVDLVQLAKIFHQQLTSRYPEFGFHVGCGINSGRAIRGNVGVDTRPEFTWVGDCVNVAFRLESLCKELKKPIVLSEEVKNVAGADFQFEDLGPQKVKGKSQDLRVYTVKI